MSAGHRLYGVEASYYAGKIRAYLRYKRIPFEEIQASRAVFAEVIMPRVGWPVIPVIVTADDVTLQDTSEMIDFFEARYSTPAIMPTSAPGRALGYWLELLGDEWLKMPALHYRWNHNYDFSVAEFGRNNDPDYSAEQQRRVGEKIARTFHGWLPRLGITARSAPVIEAGYLEFLALFDAHLEDHRYLLGDTPTLGDFAFYGPLYAHQYRDPASGPIMRRHAPRVCAWVERLREGQGRPVETLPATEPPAGLIALAACLARDFVPILVNEIMAFQRWLADHDEAGELPRYFGEHSVALGRGGSDLITETRALFSYDQWMLQRVLDVYDRATDAERRAIRALFTRIGAAAILDLKLETRVARHEFRLHRESPGNCHSAT